MKMGNPFVYVVAGLCLLLTLSPASVFADEEQSEDSRQQAAEYYQEAAELYGQGQFERAAELLGLAYSHDPNLIYRYNQILAYQGLGEYERALELLSEYEEAMVQEERFDDIGEIRGELEEAIAAIEEERAAERRAQKGEVIAISLHDEVDDPESSSTLGWALVGTGGATLAGGLFVSSGVLIGDQIDRIERSTTAPDEREVYADSPYSRPDDLTTLRRHQQLTLALVAGGTVLTSAGSFLLWRNRSDDTDLEESSSIWLEPSIGIDRAGARIVGRF